MKQYFYTYLIYNLQNSGGKGGKFLPTERETVPKTNKATLAAARNCEKECEKRKKQLNVSMKCKEKPITVK